MSYLSQPVDPRHVQDRKLEKLQQALLNMEQQMADQASLRRKLEQMGDLDEARTQQTLERANSRNKILQNEIDRVYGSNNASPTPASNKMVEEIISKRTKEFQRSQATKAATIQYLAQERQRILDARSRLKERQATLRSLPSPVGKATQRIWGHKYSQYRPLYFDDYLRIYSPTFEDGYLTLFPRKRLRRSHFRPDYGRDHCENDTAYFDSLARITKGATKGSFIFVPTKLHKAD
ncbi:hypothetical protein ElyMa_004346300 [Elysia marginata]|uniref:Uncharacterized protein n=1 Tax=Elysia marginata TaxID=1093978 RepID=A0AAV4H3V1_9GAST|nr:hypothetical protein ElyMa_004346300 [Elysia marginata]